MSDGRTKSHETHALVSTISPSKLGMWMRCQQQFAFTYIEGMRKAPSAAMVFGTAFDQTASSAYMERIAFGRLPEQEQIDSEFADTYLRARDEVEEWGDDDPDAMLDEGVALTRTWRTSIARYVEPIRVQEPIDIPIAETTASGEDACAAVGIDPAARIIGFADLRARVKDGREFIADHKVGRKRWSDADITRSVQSVVYTMGARVSDFYLHVGQRLAKGPRFEIVGRTVHAHEHDSLVNRVLIARRQIALAAQAGDFLPNREHQLCSRKWCGFWRECVAKHGGLVAE